MTRCFALPLLAALLSSGCAGAPKPPTTTTTAKGPGIRYAIGGDSRDDGAHVLPWAFREARARGDRAFLFLGDMELSPELDGHFRKALSELDPVPFYPVLGNHEIKVLGILPIGKAHAAKKFRERFLETERTPVGSSIPGKVVYSVDLPGGIHFVALDNVSQKGFGEEQLAWFAKDLEHARGDAAVRHVIVGMHKPLAKNGASTHSMDGDGDQAVADSDAALALIVKHKVSLVVASHVHLFARFEQGGVPSYITGGLGAPLVKSSGPDHAFHHFLEVEITADGLRVDVVRFDGKPSVAADDIDD